MHVTHKIIYLPVIITLYQRMFEQRVASEEPLLRLCAGHIASFLLHTKGSSSWTYFSWATTYYIILLLLFKKKTDTFLTIIRLLATGATKNCPAKTNKKKHCFLPVTSSKIRLTNGLEVPSQNSVAQGGYGLSRSP